MLVVTGGAGFIGSALVAALNARGRGDILVVDDFGDGPKWKNLRGKRFLDVVAPDTFARDLAAGAYQGKIEGILHIGAVTAAPKLPLRSMVSMICNASSVKFMVRLAP